MNETTYSNLPSMFCWTRFGTETGEPIERILERKELERQANRGVFYWGIGNSVAPGVAELVRRCDRPEVLFSPIKSRPRHVDVWPSSVIAWRVGETLLGERLALPPTVRVTSRGDVSAPPQRYALVCSSDHPLVPADLGQINFDAVRNLLSGNPLGSSQVTAIVSYADDPAIVAGLQYPVSLHARLVAPYFVRLREPIQLQDRNLADSGTHRSRMKCLSK